LRWDSFGRKERRVPCQSGCGRFKDADRAATRGYFRKDARGAAQFVFRLHIGDPVAQLPVPVDVEAVRQICKFVDVNCDFGVQLQIQPERHLARQRRQAGRPVSGAGRRRREGACDEPGAQPIAVAQVFVDTVGPPEAYQRKLEARFPLLAFCVSKKADALFAVVSAASVCAKVSRDRLLAAWTCPELASLPAEQRPALGSGYPAGRLYLTDAVARSSVTEPLFRPRNQGLHGAVDRPGFRLPVAGSVQLVHHPRAPGEEGCPGAVVSFSNATTRLLALNRPEILGKMKFGIVRWRLA